MLPFIIRFFHAEPQSLLSRGDDTCERLRSLSGLRPYEERAERPSVDVERTWNVRGAYVALMSNVLGADPCIVQEAINLEGLLIKRSTTHGFSMLP